MGTLTPGATYVYERVADVIYAREIGSHPSTRKEIGRDYDLHARIMEDKLWGDIRREAKTNPTLHEALERVKVIYYLSKKDQLEPPSWHPV
jgi:hypothetical protein